jgi:hypothetical protein
MELIPSFSNDLLSQRSACGQATYTSDGMAIFETISQLRHFSRGLLQFAIGLLSQLHPSLLARIDKDMFLRSISCVIDNERVAAPSWVLGPGWTGEDVKIGTDYKPLLGERFNVQSLQELGKKEPDTLIRLWNSDCIDSPDAYNNRKLSDAVAQWERHRKHQGSHIPVAVATERDGDTAFGVQLEQRRKGERNSKSTFRA